jgi:acyl-ACP thioesterase
MKTYEERFLLRTTHCDFTGRWRPSDILAVMQELAGMHAHLLGCGREATLQHNLVWVLSRTELVMDRYPVIGEKIRVETFPAPNKRWFFPRYFTFYDEQDRIIGKAGTLWLLMDYVQRKMSISQEVLASLPDNSDLTPPLDMPGNIAPVAGEAKHFQQTPLYTDIDVNGHVNNTRYSDWLCNALGIEAMREHEISRLLIHYTREVLPGADLTLALQREGDAFRLTGQAGEEKHFDMGGMLRKRG